MSMILTNKGIHSNSRASRKAPFCSEIRNFIFDSRRCQTLFANTEAGCNKQMESFENISSLKNFIYFSAFSKESDFSTNSNVIPEMDPKKRQLAEKVQEKMILICKKYGFKEEIYFSIVWVLYFEYESKTVGCIPLFKIYKKKFGREAEFLDLNLRSYTSWEHYLRDSDFSESFLCVPRNGEYNIFGDTLDLEFLKPARKSTASVIRDLKPFSQSAIRPFLDKMIQSGKETWEHIKSLTDIYKGSIIKLSLCVAWLSINNMNSGRMRMFQTFGKMVLGLSSAKLAFGVFPVNPGLDFNTSELTGIDNEIKNLIKLSRSPKKSWDGILLAMNSLLSKSVSLLMDIFSITRLPNFLLDLFLILRKIGLAKNNKVNNMTKSLEDVNSKGMLESLTFGNNGKTSPRVLENPMQKEIFFKNLSRLEQIFADGIERAFKKTSSTTNSLDVERDEITSPIRVGMPDGYTLYVLPKGRTDDLLVRLQNLSGYSNISLKFESDFIGRIATNSGNIIGSLYLLGNGVAVGLFPSNRVDKNIK